MTTNLTGFEAAILETIKAGNGEPVSKEKIAAAIYRNVTPPSNGIEVFVGRLRRKIGVDTIETVRGQGYRWVGLTEVNRDGQRQEAQEEIQVG